MNLRGCPREYESRTIREEIDAIDQQIQDLINARADCAMRVAEVKQAEMARSGEVPVYYCPEREAQVMARVMERPTTQGRGASNLP